MKSLITLLLIPCFVACQTNRTELEQLYLSKKYNEVIRIAQQKLELDHNDLEANSFFGQSLVKKNDFKNGLKYLEKADSLETENLARKLWINLSKAIALYQLDEYSKAQICVTKCIDLNSTKIGMKELNQFALICGFKEFYPQWNIVESEHFRFHFPPNSNIEDKSLFINKYESSFNEIQSFFNSVIPKKIDAIIWNNDEDAKSLGIEFLAFAIPPFVTLHTNKYHTVGHEMTHIITYFASAGKIKTNNFVYEGTSVCFDNTHESKINRAILYKKDHNYNTKIDLKDVWRNPKDYPEWIVYYLGSEVIRDLIDNYSKDKFIQLINSPSFESAVSIYGSDLNTVLENIEIKIN